MGGAVAVRSFQRIPNVALRGQGQAIGGHSRPGDIPAQALELEPLMGLRGDTGVQREAGSLGQATVVAIVSPSGHGLQRERLASGLRADCDTVGDRMAEQIVHGGIVAGLALQVSILDIPYQQALAFQESVEPLVDSLYGRFQRLGAWLRETAKHGRLAVGEIHAVQKQHVEMDIQIQGAAKSLDQGYSPGLGAGAGMPNLLDEMSLDGPVDETEHPALDLGPAREQEADCPYR